MRHHGLGLGRSTKASIRCSLRSLQRKATSLWIGRRAQVILATLSFQFKVVSNIPRIMINAPHVLLISSILLLDETIHVCRSSGHHIVALERDADIFNVASDIKSTFRIHTHNTNPQTPKMFTKLKRIQAQPTHAHNTITAKRNQKKSQTNHIKPRRKRQSGRKLRLTSRTGETHRVSGWRSEAMKRDPKP